MFTHIGRLLKHSAVYGLAETISRGTGFLLLFLYLRVLTDGEIGIRAALYVAAAFIGLFYTLGLDNAFLRYYMDEDLASEKRDVFSTAVYFTSIIGLLVFGAIWLKTGTASVLITESRGYLYATRLLFFVLIIDNIVIYPSLVLRAENRFAYYTIISLARFFLFIFLNMVFVWWLGRGVNGILEANTVVVLIVLVLYLPIFIRNLVPRVSMPMLKKMLLFGVPTVFTVLSMRVIDFADRRIILSVLGKDMLGLYTPAYTLGMVGIMVFVNSFRIAWQPFFMSIKKHPEQKNVFTKVATYYGLFIGFVLLGMTLFRREIFLLYAPDKPLYLANIIPFVAFSYILYGCYLIMLPGVFFREKTIFLPIATLSGAVVNVLLNLLFIPQYGLFGAAYTTIIAYGVMIVILYSVSRYLYNIEYEMKKIGVMYAVFAVMICMSLIWRPAGLFAGVLYHSAILLMAFIVIWYGGVLGINERTEALAFVKRKLMKNNTK